MKRYVLYLLVLFIAFAMISCGSPDKPRRVRLGSYADSLSFALGYIYGMDIAEVPFEFNFRLVFQGITNARHRNMDVLSEDEIIDLIGRFQDVLAGISEREEELALIRNQLAGRRYMEENAQRADVTTTASGLQYRVIRAGDGRRVRFDSDVTVHYTGRFIDGTMFDSSHNRGEPASFNVDDVIAGWSEGLQLMRAGDVFEFVIPDSLAYGRRGFDIIEPGAHLVFEVEVISIDN